MHDIKNKTVHWPLTADGCSGSDLIRAQVPTRDQCTILQPSSSPDTLKYIASTLITETPTGTNRWAFCEEVDEIGLVKLAPVSRRRPICQLYPFTIRLLRRRAKRNSQRRRRGYTDLHDFVIAHVGTSEAGLGVAGKRDGARRDACYFASRSIRGRRNGSNGWI